MSSLRQPIEDGSSSIAVAFKYKYLIFLEKSGNMLIDEQPEMSRIRRDFNKISFLEDSPGVCSSSNSTQQVH
jgi:hypothetical protein